MSIIFKNQKKAYGDAMADIQSAPQVWADLQNREFHDNISNATTTFRDDFSRIMTQVKMIQERSLIAAQDLISAGLSFSEDIKTMLVGVEDEEDFSDAVVSMNPTQEVNDESRYNATYTPMPVIEKGYRIQWRQDFDYKRDTGFRRAIRKVMVASNNIVMNGHANIVVNFNGVANTISGYTNLSGRTTTVITTSWATATTSILADVKLMMAGMWNTNKVPKDVPLIMYVPTDYWIPLQDDYSAAKGDRTFMEQILRKYPSIRDIRPDPSLATANVVLVAMDSEYVQLATAQMPIVVPHVKQVSIAPQDFTCYAVWVPILKTDSNGLTGVVHASTA